MFKTFVSLLSGQASYNATWRSQNKTLNFLSEGTECHLHLALYVCVFFSHRQTYHLYHR